MEFAPWSLAYILPTLIYATYAVAVRRTIMDPLLAGGAFLSVMFVAHRPYEQVFQTHELLLLHLAASASYWCGGLLAYRWAELHRHKPNGRPILLLKKYAWMVTAIFTLCLSGFVFVVLYKGSWELMLAMRNRPDLLLGSVVAQVGLMERLAQYLRGYLGPGAAFTVLLWCRRGQFRPLSMILLGSSILGTAVLLAAGGSRGAVLFLGLHCLFAAHFGLQRRIRTRKLAKGIGLTLVPILLLTILAQTLFRHVGFSESSWSQLQQRIPEATSAILTHISFNDEVQFVLSSYPAHYEFTNGHSLLTPWVVFVPRSIWPSKPVPWGRDLAWKTGYRHDTTVSLAATVQGEGYANFGWLGWAAFPFGFGAFVGLTFYRLQNRRDEFDLVFGFASLFGALSLRGDFHSAVAAIIFPVLVYVLALRLLAFRSSRLPMTARSAASPAILLASLADVSGRQRGRRPSRSVNLGPEPTQQQA